MTIQVRWIVIQIQGTNFWPGGIPIVVEGFTKLKPAERRATELSDSDDEERDNVVVWDAALNKPVWGPR